MGAQAGIFFLDGRPAGDCCAALGAGLRSMAHGNVSVYAEGGVAMAHGASSTWAGERPIEQLRKSRAGFAATWDGRLDNREDLMQRLGGGLPADTRDAEIALLVFERWGADGLRSLIGDWSVAIWDSRRQILHLARDYMGARPLYYCAADRAVTWSTSLGELAQRSDRADALSGAFVASFMTLGLSADLTPYVGVRAVPAATCVSFSPTRRESRRRFWQIEPADVHFANTRAYEEQLRALWREAVGTRLRVPGTVWAELSGGLDSSSVACMADLLIRSGRVPARGIRLVSHATLQSPEGDERRFIAEVEARIGVRSEIVGVEQHRECADAEWGWVTPYALQGAGLECVRRIRNAGGRIVLSGRAGDVVMGCQPDNSVAVFDDLANWRLLTALRSMRAWSRACGKPFVEIGWQLARARMRTGLVNTADPNQAPPTGITLLTPPLRESAQADAPDITLSSVRASKRDLARLLLGYSLDARLDVPNQPPGVIYTYPFLHRPLVEYMLAIPGEQLSAPGETRSLMRRAFENLVPAYILRRVSKGNYPPAALRSARQLAQSMLPVDRLEAVRRGWIDPKQLDAAIRTLIQGNARTGADVRRVLRLEQWLASRHRRAPAAIPQGKEVNTNEVLNA
jgi:asparagine synthase (glutamine-hydrolysing)